MTRLVILVITLLMISACGKVETPAVGAAGGVIGFSSLKGKVQLDGSSTVFPISEAVAEEFNNVAPKVRVTVGVSGTGGGFKKFIGNEIDINDASRSIKEIELAKARAAGVGFIELPVAFDGLSVVVNRNNNFVESLTVAELNKIWQPSSSVKTWKDVRPQWPAEEIRLYGPGPDSGTFDYFTEAINGKSQASRADFTASEDDNVLVQGIAGDQYSLGYFGYAYYKENEDKLKLIAIDGGKGAILPTPETINNGSYAPLSRPIFIYINPLSLLRPEVELFVNYYIDNAAILAAEVGYIALPDASYEAARQRVKIRETGTAYGSHSTVSRLLAE